MQLPPLLMCLDMSPEADRPLCDACAGRVSQLHLPHGAADARDPGTAKHHIPVNDHYRSKIIDDQTLIAVPAAGAGGTAVA